MIFYFLDISVEEAPEIEWSRTKSDEIERSNSKFDAAFIHNRKERGVRNLAEICRNVDLLQSFFFFFSFGVFYGFLYREYLN